MPAADRLRLKQVLVNPVDNAVELPISPGVAGIPEAKRRDIFHQLIQANSSTTRKHAGAGTS